MKVRHPSPQRWVSVREAVARTGLSERTLRQFIADGRLAVVRPSGMRVVRIPEAELDKLMHGVADR